MRHRGHVAAPPAEAAGNICRGWHRAAALAGLAWAPQIGTGTCQVLAGGAAGRTWHQEGPAARPVPASRPRAPVPPCAAARLRSQPKLFPLGEPAGLGLCSPAGEAAKATWGSVK